MMRYFIYFSYDGTAYHGWQRQPNAHTVQEELERALSTVLRVDVTMTGAGRTDAGVHARRMVAHFDVVSLGVFADDPSHLCHKLNSLLPPDIAVCSVKPVPEDAHARFDAVARTYHYYIYQDKNPFQRHYAMRVPASIDFSLMNQAAEILLGEADFTSFSKTHTDVKTNICRISRAQWVELEPGLWRFEITADRFLRGMVRAIVGTLLEVGRHKCSLQEFASVIAAKDRCAAADAAPPHALFLVDVQYG